MNDGRTQRPLHRFSGISGKVRLPFRKPPNSGDILICLIPAKVAPGEWLKNESVLKAFYKEEPAIAFAGGPTPTPVHRLVFNFDAVEPGDYKLKAFWDRRQSNATDVMNIEPGPGDYQSSEAGPITLRAGERIRDFELYCTNRVGEALAEFSADEKWAVEHPSANEEPAFRPGHVGRSKTNENRAGLVLKRIRLMAIESEGGNAHNELSIRFTIPGKKQAEVPQFEGELQDDHGCRFQVNSYGNFGRTYEMQFPIVPLGSKEMHLRISTQELAGDNGRPFRNGPRTSTLASFTLRNLYKGAPAEWKPEALPARRDLDIVSVELASFDARVHEFADFPHDFPPQFLRSARRGSENEFAFSADGRPVKGWRKYSAYFQDRWGNQSGSVNAFCRAEEVFKYVAEFARDPQKAAFLPEERLEIPISKVPGAGESIALGLKKTVQGAPLLIHAISGTGEFEYEGGRVTHAKAEMDSDDEAAVPRFGIEARMGEPKLRVIGRNGPPQFALGGTFGDRSESLTLVSKIPHVVCALPPENRQTLISLLEQDTSVEDPLNPSQRGMPRYFRGWDENSTKYIALEHRPGETDRKLTFIVQKVRRAEFILRVPKSERAEAER